MYPLALLACYVYYIGFDLMFKLLKINSEASNANALRAKILSFSDASVLNVKQRRLNIKSDFEMLRLSLMPEIDRGIKTIGILASVAPLLGLLGTVSGMTLAIANMGDASMSVAEGISRALITTQCGLLIAIPALVMRLACSRLRQKILIKYSRFESALIMEEARA